MGKRIENFTGYIGRLNENETSLSFRNTFLKKLIEDLERVGFKFTDTEKGFIKGKKSLAKVFDSRVILTVDEMAEELEEHLILAGYKLEKSSSDRLIIKVSSMDNMFISCSAPYIGGNNYKNYLRFRIGPARPPEVITGLPKGDSKEIELKFWNGYKKVTGKFSENEREIPKNFDEFTVVIYTSDSSSDGNSYELEIYFDGDEYSGYEYSDHGDIKKIN